jgi:peptidoglycan/xylan/chitin deacetylase (PgdA/CDA1 family)
MLERHLDWIGRQYHFVSLDDLTRSLEHGDRGRPLAAVSFDDGYRDVYENAFPLLVRKGIPAAVFVVTDLVGTDRLQLHDELYVLLGRVLAEAGGAEALSGFLVDAGVEAMHARQICMVGNNLTFITHTMLRALPRDRLRCVMTRLQAQVGTSERCRHGLLSMTWSMVREMHRAGITIGSHTSNHVLLPNESLESLAHETDGSRRALEARLGVPVEHFAYPDGCFNTAAVGAVADSGYRYGYTTCSHRDPQYPLLTIPRSLLWEHSSVDTSGQFSPAILACQTHGLLVGKRTCNAQSHA